MGQNSSSSGLQKRASKRFTPSDFNPPSEVPSSTRRSTMSGATASRRRASTGGANALTTIPAPRRATSSASTTLHAAHRANNIASPPPYSATTRVPLTIPEVPPPVNNMVSPGVENALELLKWGFPVDFVVHNLTGYNREYDTVFLIDDSGSMAGSLWREAGKALEGVARVAAQYDDDGIDIHFLNSKESMYSVTNEDQVRDLFTRIQPRGQTPTGSRLDSLLRPYISSIEQAYQETSSTDASVTGIKPANFIVITDGAPTDEPEDVIVAAARRLDRGNFPLSQLG
ncbi:hypothetical protein FRC06_011179, partial [Ceratobasidium sp. 370]